MTSTVDIGHGYDPRAKLDVQDNPVFLSGTQALVRIVFDQLRHDRAAGLRTASFVSGYPGSPLGGFDLELGRQRRLMAELGVTHLPGHNEELAATSVYGTQMAQTFGDATHDGVLGVWYGKGPGLDRAADAIRHGQYVGTSRHGGVLALVGDDPSCKSSSIPNTTEQTLQDLGLPVLVPSSVADVLELGPHGVALSRLSGLWTAVRVVTDIADGTATVAGSGTDADIVVPAVHWQGKPFTPSLHGIPGPPWSLQVEAELRGPRLEVARQYGYLNQLNRITVSPDRPRVSIIAVGHLFGETMTALRDLGLDEPALLTHGIRVCQVRLQHPLDARTLHEFAAGAERVVVVEEKRPVVERVLKETLYRSAEQPIVVGKEDEDGRPLIPLAGGIHTDELTGPLRAQLTAYLPEAVLRRPRRGRVTLPLLDAARAPYFCSGCPHNTSTKVPDGALIGGGIGCHGITQLMDPAVVGNVASTTHMGTEGAQWFGIAPYVTTGHMFQNLGDGTYFHSGQLAVQAAVAAGATITYKLLYNGAIAMTGGQNPSESNALGVPDLVEILLRQGVRRIIVTTEDRRRYRRARMPRAVEVWDRSRVVEAQETLRQSGGVTVLIHDQRCAAENRRDRRRGRIPTPTQRVFINERICEGCGDCGAKSNCLSVEPVDTEFGRKTQINQTTCNSDYSCVAGDCPSFVTVVPRGRRETVAPTTAPSLGALLAEPIPSPVALFADRDITIRMPGIGGTGVVTASQIIGTAAMLDGRVVQGMDQTGLSQKAGPVISDLHIAPVGEHTAATSSRAHLASVDLLLAFDLLGVAVDTTVESLAPGHTVAVVATTQTPTGAMVSDVNTAYPDTEQFRSALENALGERRVHWLDTGELSERIAGDRSGANVMLIGAAVQAGAVPVNPASIEAAIELNGIAVQANRAAFRAGRWWVADRDRLLAALPSPDAEQPPSPSWFAESGLPDDVRTMAARRAEDLLHYQDQRYAQRYVELVAAIAAAEQRTTGGSAVLTQVVAANLYKLMAYKDEYEVARLSLDPVARERITEAFGPDVKVYWNLHPPILRDHGLKSKLRLGAWFTPAYRTLTKMRRLRGTALDPFGRTEVRRLERRLVAEYTAALEALIPALCNENLAAAIALATLPDGVRGYEKLKLDSGSRFLDQLAEARRSIGIQRQSGQIEMPPSTGSTTPVT
ncbi:MAG TPA: indolepyruvate ferredoxin oxidoreductase family protein [Pseudonocardiaceae bacterium]|nr:indolepyruvate ferredoxin oxidoreductase family protein [Pseudonocardiaceae bacterium]